MAKVIEVNFNSGEVVDDEEDQAATKSRHPASNAGGTLPSTNNGITRPFDQEEGGKPVVFDAKDDGRVTYSADVLNVTYLGAVAADELDRRR